MKKYLLLLSFTVGVLVTLFCFTPTLLANNKAGFIAPFPYSAIVDEADNSVDDDVRAAAKWFVNEYGGTYIGLADIVSGSVNLNQFDVLWIHFDNDNGLTDLPPLFLNQQVLNPIQQFYKNGGNLFLSTHAVQYLNNLERVTTVPNSKGASPGTVNGNIYYINPNVFDLHDYYSDENYIYKDLIRVDKYYTGTKKQGHAIPLSANGVKQDHNTCWNLNGFTVGTGQNEIEKFENAETAKILATWSNTNSADKSAVIVEFLPTSTFQGTCIAIGVGSYEWNMLYGNPFHSNIKLLTRNVLNYLQGLPTGLSSNPLHTVASEADEGMGSLRQLIDDAASGDSIVIPENFTIQLKSPIVFSKSLKINGQGCTIKAAVNRNVFRIGDLIDGSNNIDRDTYFVRLSNINLQGGDVSEYPFFNAADETTNVWIRRGGVIYFDRNMDVIVENCSFHGAKANLGGAIYYSSAVKVSSTYKNCVFTSNEATNASGAMRIFGTARLDNCIFTDNRAKNNIGTLQIQNFTRLNSCSFSNNSAGGNFGAILISSNDGVIIENTVFENNQSTGKIGAIGIEANRGPNEFIGCSFINNKGKTYTGAIEVLGPTTIDSCLFEENTTDYNASAITLATTAIIKNSYFKDNRAVSSNPAAIGSVILNSTSDVNAAPTLIENCTFEGNTAEGSGKLCAVFHAGNAKAKTNIVNSTFFNNTAPHGAISCARGELNLINSTITGNKATEVVGDTVFAGGVTVFLPASETAYPTVRLVNSIVAYNYNTESGTTADFWNLENALTQGSNNLIGTSNGTAVAWTNPITFNYSTGFTDDSPLFKAYSVVEGYKIPDIHAESHVVDLSQESVVKNAGTQVYESLPIPTTDQLGNTRNVPPSLGAVELKVNSRTLNGLPTNKPYRLQSLFGSVVIQSEQAVHDILVVDLAGRVVAKEYGSTVISTKNWEQGIYIFKINLGGSVLSEKLLIKP